MMRFGVATLDACRRYLNRCQLIASCKVLAGFYCDSNVDPPPLR